MKRNKTKLIQGITEDDEYTIKDLNIKQIIPNIVDNYLITILEDHHTIVMPSNVTGMQFKEWSRGRGGVFSRDVLYYSLKRKTGKYILIKGKDIYCIARIISDEEQEMFNDLKIIDGQLKDIIYMLLRNLKIDDSLTNTNKYIEKDIVNEEVAHMVINDYQKILKDDDDNYRPESISLIVE